MTRLLSRPVYRIAATHEGESHSHPLINHPRQQCRSGPENKSQERRHQFGASPTAQDKQKLQNKTEGQKTDVATRQGIAEKETWDHSRMLI